jgi:hypothetical protein
MGHFTPDELCCSPFDEGKSRPQNLQTDASLLIVSAQYGHFFSSASHFRDIAAEGPRIMITTKPIIGDNKNDK